MDKAYIEQAAEDYAQSFVESIDTPIKLYRSDLLEGTKVDFTAGVDWLLSVQEELEATKKS
jgi:hypothetical protein